MYGEPIAHYNVGVLLQHQGKRELAIREFAMAADQDPGMNEAREWLDRLNADRGPRTVGERADGRRRDDHELGSAGRASPAIEGENAESNSSRRAPPGLTTYT